MTDRKSIRVDGLGILLLGQVALLGMLFAFTAQWSPSTVNAECLDACLAMTDLVAQNSMASAAWGMLAVSVFTAVVGVVTIVFLAMTLRETRQATAVAREIGEKQARAYLDVTACTLRTERFLGMTGTTITIINTGASPARKLHVTAVVRAYEHRVEDDGNDHELVLFKQSAMVPIHAISGSGAVDAHVQFFTTKGPRLAEVVEESMSMIDVTLHLQYETVFGETDTEVTRFTGAQYAEHTLDKGIEMKKSTV